MIRKIIVGGIAWAFITIFLPLNVLANNTSRQNASDDIIAQRDSRVVVSQGTALINNEDRSSARIDAINDALKKAVEQTVGMLISTSTVTEDYNLLNNNIYSHADDYVHDYKVLNEGVNNNVYNITLQVTIGIKHLKNELDKLNLASSSRQEPTVAVIILEQNIGEKRLESALFYAPLSTFDNYIIPEVRILNEVGNMSIAENEMTKKLLASGVNVEDEAVLLKNIKLSPGFMLQSLNDTTVKDIGSLAKVDIVVYGKAVARLYGAIAGSEMKSAQADVSLRAVDVKTGRVLAAGSEHAASVNIDPLIAGDEAIKKATDKLADTMIPTILSQWKQSTGGLHTGKVVVSGIVSPAELTALKDNLITGDGVKKLSEESIGNGQASLGMEYNGSFQQVLSSIFANKSITSAYNITTTNENTIILTKK
ncbi:MAG: flagellar assembly protein T N-terminal domain-containing protein [bacterium]